MFALLASNLGGWVGQSFFFFLIWTQMIFNIIHVCAFLGMQSFRIDLIPVLEGMVFHHIWLKYLFGTVTIYSDILTFLFKNTKLIIKKKEKKKKKKPTLMVGKGQTNIFFFRPHDITYSILPIRWRFLQTISK